MKEKCPFCNDTGIVKTIDFAELPDIPDGTYLLTELIDKYGEYVPCCEGCKPMN